MNKLIIETPSLAPLPNRIGWAMFTAVFWILWVYLWIPLITLGLWWWGIHMFDKFLLSIPPMEQWNTESLVSTYVTGVLLLCSALVAWAAIEFIRFRNVHQRLAPPVLTASEIAAYLEVTPEKIALLNSARRMVIHHDEHGRFLDAEPG